MNRSPSPDVGSITVAWRWWATAIIPAIIILPFYIFPLRLGRPIDGYDGRRLMEILWAAGIALALLRPTVRHASARIWLALPRTSRLTIGAFVLLAVLSAGLSAAPPYALREWGLMTLLLVTTLPLAALLGPVRSKVLEAMGLSLLLYAILVFPDPMVHGFTHPRFLGQVVAVAAPALLFSGNLTLALMAAPVVALGLLNGSRALALTMVVITAATPFLWSDRRRRMVPGLVALGVAGLLLAVLVWMGHDSGVQEAVQRGTSSTGRYNMWRDALARFLGAPVLGVGPGILARSPGVADLLAHPHNTVLLIAAETGIVGLSCIGLLVVRGLRRIPRLDDSRRPWALALLAGGFHSLFSGTVIMPASQTLLTISLALVLSPTTGSEDRGGRTGWVLLGAGSIALAVLMATLFLPPAELTRLILAPRFFLRGIIP